MDQMLLRVFQRHVLDQCEFMQFAAQDVNSSLKAQDISRIFYALQNFLTAAGNVRKALWGAGNNAAIAVRRKSLRDSINVDDSSPLNTATMRNHFEHFDERIEDWWHKSTQRTFVDLNIGPPSAFTINNPSEKFRTFDPQTTDVYFWGDEINMQELIDELQRILPKLQEEADKID